MVRAVIHEAKNNGLQPRFNRIKILPDTPEDRPTSTGDGDHVTKGGIIIPKSAEGSVTSLKLEKQLTGIIVAIGENVEALNIGERVVFGEFSGLIRFENENGLSDTKAGIGYRYMNEADVIASFVTEE